MSSFIAKKLDDNRLQDRLGEGGYRDEESPNAKCAATIRPDRAQDLNRFATRSIFLQRKAVRSVLAVKGFTSANPAPLTGCGPI